MLPVDENPTLTWSMQNSWTRSCRATFCKALASFSYVALSAELLRQTTSAWNALSLGLAKRRSCRMSSTAPFLKPRCIDNWYHSSGMLTATSYSSSSEGDPMEGIIIVHGTFPTQGLTVVMTGTEPVGDSGCNVWGTHSTYSLDF